MARSGGNSVPERPMIGTIREKIPKKTSIMITAGMAILVSMTNRYVDNEDFQSGLMILAMYSLMISGGKVQNIAIKAEASPAVVSMNVNTDQIKREASKWISSIILGWIFFQK